MFMYKLNITRFSHTLRYTEKMATVKNTLLRHLCGLKVIFRNKANNDFKYYTLYLRFCIENRQ